MAASSNSLQPPPGEVGPAARPLQEDPPKRKPTFGGLKENAQGRSQRANMQFFDSADWVLKNRGRDPALQSPTPGVLAAFTKDESWDAPVVGDSE
jgi:hypothetical protein